MKTTINTIIQDEGRKLKTGWFWYVFAAVVFIVIPQTLSYLNAQALEEERGAILAAPDSDYLEFVRYEPSDVCVSDTTQTILLERHPGNTETGWNAAITDEIGVKVSKGVWGKYNGDYEYTPFYEVIPETAENPANTLILEIPLQQPYRPGTFRWESQITLFIPMSNGEVVPKKLERVISDEFVVTELCRTSDILTVNKLEDVISEINE